MSDSAPATGISPPHPALRLMRSLLEPTGPRTRRSMWIDAGVLAFLSLLTVVVLVINARRRFEFFDMSAFLDAGYRVAIGQTPYVDFHYNAGPVHLYMHALSFKLFGFSQTAVLVHLCSVALAVTAILYGMARVAFGVALSAFIAVLGIFSFYGSTSHPWYDHNAAFFVILVLPLWQLRELYWKESALPYVGFVSGMLLGLSFLTKSNVALAGGVAMFFLLLSGPNRIRATVFYVLGGLFCLALFALFMREPWWFIDQAFLSFAPGKRLGNLGRFLEVIADTPHNFIAVLTAACALCGGWVFTRRHASELVLSAGVTFIAFFGAWTGSMSIRGHTLWLAFQMLFLFRLAQKLLAEPESQPELSFNTLRRRGSLGIAVVVAGLSAVALFDAVKVTRELEVWAWNSHVLISDYELQTPEFRGWACNRQFGEPLDQTVQYVKEKIPREDSLLVIPDCTMIYGLTGRDSFRKMPFIFHHSELVRAGWYDDLRQNFFAHPPRWIVIHEQTDHPYQVLAARPIMDWLKLNKFIDSNYQIVWRSGDFQIMKMVR